MQHSSIDISELSVDELWMLYAQIHEKLIELGEIRSKNIIGDLGEKIAIEKYNSISGLPKLQLAPPSTKNIDAISTKGERYSIKTISYPNKTTGVFHGYGSPDKPIKDKKFEYLIVVVLEAYRPKLIVELSWDDFYELKSWHSVMRAYNISLTKKTLEKAKVIYKS